ncbi:MAG: hypothetical protein QGG71_20205 [Pirellulaceae bacterium]|nr:hypothetical protein [Pirellulaceae bacterium]
MTTLGTQRMACYDMFERAQQTTCYICGEGNCVEVTHCARCGAPTALSHDVDRKQTSPHRVAVLGGPGVGKTVYLGMLMDMLSRQQGALQITARGAFSVSLQQSVMTALAGRRFPSPTQLDPQDWNWVHCEVKRSGKRRAVEIVLPDLAGTSFVQEVDHPNSCAPIRHFLQQCVAAMVLIDASQLEQGDHDQDYWAMKIIAFLHELDHTRKTGWQRRRLALVFAKCDQSEACFDDPEGFARTRVPGLWKACHDHLPRHRFFATSVVGATARITQDGRSTSVPLRVEPRGVVEPFSWLIERLSNRWMPVG